jgi:rare lipoprotein A
VVNVRSERIRIGWVLRTFVLPLTLYASLLTVVSCAPTKYDVQQGKTAKFFLVASWYGPDFQGRPTSSGETFDMNALTCAHKEYPFGTRLKVTNTSNNKSVECIVNDRGPFIKGRDIDLSYAAARQIDLIAPGIASVQIEIQGRDTSYIRTVKVQSTDKRGPFAIQVGAFSDSVNAVRLKVSLRPKYANAHIQETEVKGATWYRVRVGNFDQFSQAMETAEQLGQEGYPALIVKADLKM